MKSFYGIQKKKVVFKMTAMELLLLINSDDRRIYYDPIDSCFTNEFINQKKVEKILTYKKKEDIQISDPVYNIQLPRYREIDHEEIMRFFVRECIEDKKIRKTLFSILRRIDYVDPFIDKLKELGLYNDFDDCCGSVYDQILREWAEQHGIDLTNKNK